jgi:hypothetical protein
MDEIVARSLARWPNVPAVFGWLELDRRGNWLIKGERIGNPALREFISRNYEADREGRWFFQNGPQRVYIKLAYTPLVVHYEGDALVDHCGRKFESDEVLLDDEGSVLLAGRNTVALLDDRDLERFAERAGGLARIDRAEVPRRFRFVQDPRA